MPKIQIEYPPNTRDPAAITAYLRQMADKVNYMFNNIDVSSLKVDNTRTVADLATITEQAKSIIELVNNNELAKTKNLQEKYTQLANEIVNSAAIVTAAFQSLVSQTDSEIKTYVESNYLAQIPGATLDEYISSMIQQTADQIRLEFNTLMTLDVDALNELSADFSTYIRFSATGIEIGKIGDGASPVVTRITNERLEFLIAGTDTVLAYIDGATNKLHINAAEIEGLSIGNSTNGYVDIEMQSTGLYFKWRS